MALPDCNCINNGADGYGPCIAHLEVDQANNEVVRVCPGPPISLRLRQRDASAEELETGVAEQVLEL